MMKRKTVKKLIFIPLGSLVVLFGLAVGLAALLLTPKRLTPLVSGLCDQYLEAQVRFDTVDVALFSNFPHVTVRLRGAQVVSEAFASLPDSVRAELPAGADTLARIGRLDVSLNALGLLSGRADVRRVSLADTYLNAVVATDGTANWDIYLPDTTATTDTSTAFVVNINRLTIRDGLQVHYVSQPDTLSGSIALKGFTVRGKMSTDLLQTDIRRLRLRDCRVAMEIGGKRSGLVLDSLTVTGRRRVDYTVDAALRQVEWEGLHWLDSLRLHTEMEFTGADHRKVDLRAFALKLNDMQITAGGTAALRGDSVTTDLAVQTHSLRFAELLAVIPTEVLPLARAYETNLMADIDLRVEGTIRPSTRTWPNITLNWRMPNGYLAYTQGKRPNRIDTLALDMTLRYRPQAPDSTGLDLRRLQVSGGAIHLYAEAQVNDLLRDAAFNGKVQGNLSLDYLTQHFPSKNGTTLHGRVSMDVRGRARLSQLNVAQAGGALLGGFVQVDTLRLRIPQQEFSLMVGHGRLGLGTGTARNDSLVAKGSQAVGAMIKLDTVDLQMGELLRLRGRQLAMQAATSARTLVLDTTAVQPSQGKLSAEGLRIESGDSLVLIGRGLEADWTVRPAPGAPRVPRIGLQMEARRLTLRDADSRFVIRRGNIGLFATLNRPDSAQRARREQRLDSLQRLYPNVARDSLFAHVRSLRGPQQPVTDEFSSGDIDMQVSSDLGALLRRWQLYGRIQANTGRIMTPYFPLKTVLRNVDITFNTNQISLNRTFVKAGHSQMRLTGEVSGFRRAMMGRGTLKGNLTVEADTLNLNEIIRVANAGSTLVAQGGIGETESDDQLEQRLTQSIDTASASTLLVVPGNIDMTFDMTVHRGLYANLALDSLFGEVQVRNRAIQLSDLTMRSNAGNLKMTGLYATRTPQDIQTGFDLEMDKIQVARLIELIPSIDTLMPMLRSFEGVVDCQIALTARLDSAMNILLPSLNAACHLDGDSLVLLDGETFAEISKKLMFKNKKRNLIDHISAEVLVRDSQIEIFPFVVEIDRYRAAVSGVHKMDMNFNYHISVLKSPIPFRLGIDIFGNLDDFDFKITKARYKDANLPTRVELIEDTRLNLRNYIREVFLRGPRAEDSLKLHITPDTESPLELLPAADSLSTEESVGLSLIESAVETEAL